MTAHDHRTHVEGCYRCELSRDEPDLMTALELSIKEARADRKGRKNGRSGGDDA